MRHRRGALLFIVSALIAGCETIAGYEDNPPTSAPTSSASGVCPSSATSCGGACVATSDDPRACGDCSKTCAADQRCSAGACVCRSGTTSCDGRCVETESDPSYCGGCGRVCDSGEVCASGSCRSFCWPGTSKCTTAAGTGCAKLSRDPANCGSCGAQCATGELCVDGACRAFAPAPGCTSCPCDACKASGSTCCSRPSGAKFAICVAGSKCN